MQFSQDKLIEWEENYPQNWYESYCDVSFIINTYGKWLWAFLSKGKISKWNIPQRRLINIDYHWVGDFVFCDHRHSFVMGEYFNSFLALSGIFTFEDVFTRVTKPILLKRLFAQLEESMSILPTTSGYLGIRTLAVDVAKFGLIVHPRIVNALM